MLIENKIRRKSSLQAGRMLPFLVLALSLAPGLRGGPPFLTDDPEPVDFNHWEFYCFGLGDRAAGTNTVWAPAFEFNYGVAQDTQLHLIAPIADVSSPDSGWSSGYGDTEVGIKYRFLQETDWRPQIAIFPLAELATGNGGRGLGNGRTWYELPVWAQKSWGPWTMDGGGGVALNSASGQRNDGYGGLLVQRDIGSYLTLGTELFQEGATTAAGRASTIANAGGYLKFSENFNLLFSAGRSISGERQTVWYVGLYWTGGPEPTGRE
jgi:hypothetical protein